MRYFRSMHFTSESSEGTHKQLLRFVFKLPPRDQMAAVSKLIDLVPMFIDIGEGGRWAVWGEHGACCVGRAWCLVCGESVGEAWCVGRVWRLV